MRPATSVPRAALGQRARLARHGQAVPHDRAGLREPQHVDQRAAGEPVLDLSPEPSATCTPSTGTPASASSSVSPAAPASHRTLARGRHADLLERSLGRLVVAGGEHLGHDLGERRRVERCRRPRPRAPPATAPPTAMPRASRRSVSTRRVGGGVVGRHRRRVGAGGRELGEAVVDHQAADRAHLVLVDEPPGERRRIALGVVAAAVADHTALDAGDARVADGGDEAVDVVDHAGPGAGAEHRPIERPEVGGGPPTTNRSPADPAPSGAAAATASVRMVRRARGPGAGRWP